MPDVFISHSIKDRTCIEKEILPILRRHRITYWFALTDIKAAEQWEQSIRNNLANCKWFLVVMSPNSALSKWVEREVHWAMEERQNRIIPVLLKTCDINAWHLGIRSIQFVDFSKNKVGARRRLLAVWGIDQENNITPWKDPLMDTDTRELMEDHSLVKTKSGGAQIELIINKDFNEFDSKQKDRLCNAIKELLGISHDIRVISTRPGSVRLILDLTPEQAEQLLRAVQAGELAEFDVTDAKLVEEPQQQAQDTADEEIPPGAERTRTDGLSGTRGRPPTDKDRVDTESILLFQKYRVSIVLSGAQFPRFPLTILEGQGKIHGREADRKNIESYWPLFWSEWNLYPPELMKKTKMKHIILCEGLAYEGPSLSRPQPRMVLSDLGYTSPPDHHLYIDVASYRHDELYVRAVLHHEFFHIIDWCDDDSLDKDDAWNALNPPGFSYGTGGDAEQENSFTAVLAEDEPGFLNQYSRSGLTEDKAEIFANMVVAPHYMAERAMRDDIIKKKMQKMEERLRAFCPQVDDQFWNQTRKVERPKKEVVLQKPVGRFGRLT